VVHHCEALQLHAHQRLHRTKDGESEVDEDNPGWLGSGQGRPLFELNTIELSKRAKRKQCTTVRFDKKTHALTADPREHDVNSVAWGCYEDRVPDTGWGSLSISSTDRDDIPLVVRAYGAGFLEGLLTYQRVVQFGSNVHKLAERDAEGHPLRMQAVEKVLHRVLAEWEKYAGGDAHAEPTEDLPRQAWAALLQLRGIRDGCNYMAMKRGQPVISLYQLLEMNMHYELAGIMEVYTGSLQVEGPGQDSGGKPENSFNLSSWPVWAAHMSHGSGVVRRLGTRGDADDLVTGGVTMGNFGEMIRIAKHYHLHFGNLVKGFSMSSYPGCISSTDDYIITTRGWVLLSAWFGQAKARPMLDHGGMPAFLRATLAMRLATNQRTWAKVYGALPGLAGGKQWLIVDYSLMKEGQGLANDTVWLVESLPTEERAGDVTEHVRQDGFFEIHGAPFFRAIREALGWSPTRHSSRDQHRFSALHDKAGTIRGLASAREVLTEVEPSRDANIQLPVAPRLDLGGTVPIPYGAIDAKVASRCLVQKLAFQGRSSPGILRSGLPFSWDNNTHGFAAWPHLGVPAVGNKDWVDLMVGGVSSPLAGNTSACAPASLNLNSNT